MNYIEELKEKNVLSRQDIEKIRDRIQEMKAEESEEMKAKFLAGAVQKQYLLFLAQFEAEKREAIYKQLLAETAKQHFEKTSGYDVFTYFVEASKMEEQEVQTLQRWVNHHTKSQVDVATLRKNALIKRRIKEVKREEGKGLSDRLRLTKTWAMAFWKKISIKRPSFRRWHAYGIEILLFILLLLEIWRLFFFLPGSVPKEETMPSLAGIQTADFYYVGFNPGIFEKEVNTYGFREYDHEKLKTYLTNHNSFLADDQYYDTIVYACRFSDMDPLLLFAIIGQEQGFVPQHEEYASQIINNPYNVFGSWKKYNTTFSDATYIAIRTVHRSLKAREEGEDAFWAINKVYAEDQNWHKGVSFFYGYFDKNFR